MYESLFIENKRKNSDICLEKKSSIPLSSHDFESMKDTRRYISNLSARKNPDILLPNGNFLKGNMYFKRMVTADAPPEDSEKEEGQQSSPEKEEEMEDDDDAFLKMKNQVVRYFIEENPTIKCRNCLQFGHFAKDCTNATKRPACILCGKESHDSFNCNEKLCFKCNKVGHIASACQERNIIQCNKCGMNGHKESRCLKIWSGPHNDDKLRFARCIECGKLGHLKCTKDRTSRKIKIDCTVEDNLDEFLKKLEAKGKQKSKTKSKEADEEDDDDEIMFSFHYVDEEQTKWLKMNTNVQIPEQDHHRSHHKKSS